MAAEQATQIIELLAAIKSHMGWSLLVLFMILVFK